MTTGRHEDLGQSSRTWKTPCRLGGVDPVARTVADHRVLVRARHAVVLRRADALRHLLLDLLPQQPHQPVLLRVRQPAVQEDVHSHHQTRLATLIVHVYIACVQDD